MRDRALPGVVIHQVAKDQQHGRFGIDLGRTQNGYDLIANSLAIRLPIIPVEIFAHNINHRDLVVGAAQEVHPSIAKPVACQFLFIKLGGGLHDAADALRVAGSGLSIFGREVNHDDFARGFD